MASNWIFFSVRYCFRSNYKYGSPRQNCILYTPSRSIIVSTIPPPHEQQLHLLRFCSLFVGGAIALFPSISVTSSTQPRDPIDTRPHHQIVSSSTLNLPRLDILISVDDEYSRHWSFFIVNVIIYFSLLKENNKNIFIERLKFIMDLVYTRYIYIISYTYYILILI